MVKTEFDPTQKWVIEETGDADVYRIVKEDKSDWIAVLRCNAIHNPGFQSADGITNVKAMVAAPDLLRACLLAYVKLTSIGEHNCEQTAKILDKAIKKAIE